MVFNYTNLFGVEKPRPLAVETPKVKEQKPEEKLLVFSKIANETFDEFITYLTADAKAELNAKLNQLPDQDNKVAEVKKALEENNLQAPIILDKDFALYALLALKKGAISGLTYSTSQLFYNVFHDSETPEQLAEIQVVKLFDGDAPNPKAKQMVQYTSKVGSGIDYKDDKDAPEQLKWLLPALKQLNSNLSDQSQLTEEQINHFFEMMRQLPPLEQQYFVIPDTEPPRQQHPVEKVAQLDTPTYITQRLPETGWNVFCHFIDENKKPFRIIPSKGMMQVFLLAKSFQNAPILTSRADLAEGEDMQHIVEKQGRVMGIDSSALKTIEEADTFKCKRRTNDVTTHDHYHGTVMTEIPEKHQRKLSGVAAILRKALKENPKLDATLKKNIEDAIILIIDMEHVEYKQHKMLNIPITDKLVWTVIAKSIGASDQSKQWMAEYIVKELVHNADAYQVKYGIGTPNGEAFTEELRYEWSMLTMRGDAKFASILENELSLVLEGKPLPELIKLTQHIRSYLIRDRALKLLKANCNDDNLEEILQEARNAGAHKAINVVRDYVIDTLDKFILNQKEYNPETIEFLRHRIQHSLSFDSLIKSALFEKNRTRFDWLMHGEDFIKKNINRVFGDAFTLMQTAVFCEDENMIRHLVRLGASPNLQPGQTSNSPMFIAFLRGNEQLSMLLLNLGANDLTLAEGDMLEDAANQIEDFENNISEGALTGSYTYNTESDIAKSIAIKEWSMRRKNSIFPNLDTVKYLDESVDLD